MLRALVIIVFMAAGIPALGLAKTIDGQIPKIIVSETGKGTAGHQFTVESEGLFRLVWDATMNYGLSGYYDLIADPDGRQDLAQNYTDYIPPHEQGALFNHVIFPGDLIGHVASAGKQHQDVPRSLQVIEASPVRVIVECRFHPMLDAKVNKALQFITRYTVYPSGQLYIQDSLIPTQNMLLKEWRHGVMGVGDPGYQPQHDQGMGRVQASTIVDQSKNWRPDEWQGYDLEQSGYNRWRIAGNTENSLLLGERLNGTRDLAHGNYRISSPSDAFGWLRGTHLQESYTYHGEESGFLFMHWDRRTPEPYQSWSRASFLIVQAPHNETHGRQGVHAWRGFKRFFFRSPNVALRAGIANTRHYLMRLGTRGSPILPDISNIRTAARLAQDYRQSPTLQLISGSVLGTGWDYANGGLMLRGRAGKVDLKIAPLQQPWLPLQVQDLGETIPGIKVNGIDWQHGSGFVYVNQGATMQLLLRVPIQQSIHLVIQAAAG